MRLYECFNLSQGIASTFKCLIYTFLLLIDVNYDLMIFLFVLMVLDTLFGIGKSLRLGIKIKRDVFLLGMFVKFLILILPFTFAILGITLGYNAKIFADSAVKLLLMNEALSILANFLSIKNNKKVENIDLITITINFVRKQIVNYLNKYLNDKYAIKTDELKEDSKK